MNIEENLNENPSKLSSTPENIQGTDAPRTKLPGGPGLLTAAHNPKPFTKDHQPTPEQKAKALETRAANSAMRKKFKNLMELNYTFSDGSPIKKAIEEAFGKKALKKMSAAEIMHIQQVMKAIKQADTNAYNAAMRQAFGEPTATHELMGKDGEPLQMGSAPVTFVVNTVDKFDIAESEDLEDEPDPEAPINE